MRSPFTGIVFLIELTHDINMLLPLMVAVVVAHAFTVLVLHRSILTEKISRRGFHLTREYATDPLEILFVREVMRTSVVVLPEGARQTDLAGHLHADQGRGQTLYPVVDASLKLLGVLTRRRLKELADGHTSSVTSAMERDPVLAYPDEPLRVVVYRMAETGRTRMPVVDSADSRKLLGMVSLNDLLKARTRNLEEERTRERVLRLRIPIGVLAGSSRQP
jgi:CBS domain-containing protein